MRALPFLLALLTLAAPAARAGTVQITVTGSDGKPAANAVVQLVSAAAPARAAPPPTAPVVITQEDIRFVPFVSVVPVGGSVRFVNRDGFDHHVRSMAGGPLGSVAPAKQFELRVGAMQNGKTQSADIVLDQAGVIVLGCHLHGSMRGHVFVSATPWAAVSDGSGRVRIENVPDGAAELRVWHPEQLTDQPPQALQVGAESSAQARLNFAPRVRAASARPAAPSGEYQPTR